MVVEAHAVDDALLLYKAEEPRPGVPGLRRGRNRPGLDEAEAQRAEGVNRLAVLVEPRGKPQTVGELKAHDLDRILGN